MVTVARWIPVFAITLIAFFASVQDAQAYRSCRAILFGGASVGSGVYTIDPDDGGPLAAVQVYCDMVRDGGGWTLVLKAWYQAGVFGMTGAVGTVADGLTLKGNGYKLSDAVIRALIGPTHQRRLQLTIRLVIKPRRHDLREDRRLNESHDGLYANGAWMPERPVGLR